MTHLTPYDIPHYLRRQARRSIDWVELRQMAVWVSVCAVVVLVFSVTLMVMTSLMMMHWESGRVSGDYQVRMDGPMTTLSEVCANYKGT